MEDRDIVSLYWNRNEQAIEETSKKYGRYCYSIAFNILSSKEDAEESVNDAYMGTWNSIPPHKPVSFSTFIGKITRNVALKKWRDKNADKRGGGQMEVALDELLECIPSGGSIDEHIEKVELTRIINEFLRSIDDKERRAFVCRYWYFDSISDIAKRFGYGQSKVKMMLMRTRKKMMAYLDKEGVYCE